MKEDTLRKIAEWADRSMYLDSRSYSEDKPEIVEIKEEGNAIYIKVKIKEKVGEIGAQ